MKIAIIGHGRMGQAIERIARERGHEITAVVDVDNPGLLDTLTPATADVAIEFTTPGAAADNCRRLVERGIPVVSGTTGWQDGLAALRRLVDDTPGAAMVWSSNYSIGVNIFFELNRRLARIMAHCPQYRPEVHEVHHIHKLDHPSGTAVTLAEGIVAEHPAVDSWQEPDGPLAPGALAVSHRRLGETPGTHTVTWTSPVDSIAITHTAFTRDSFAMGAVLAAEWLPGNPGFHGMEGLLDTFLH